MFYDDNDDGDSIARASDGMLAVSYVESMDSDNSMVA